MSTPPTPSTIEDGISADSPIIVAIVEGQKSSMGFIGMASLDLVTLETELQEFRDPTYELLQQRLEMQKIGRQSIEVVLPNTRIDKAQYIIKSNDGLRVVPIDYNNFNDAIGLECVQRLAINPQSLESQVRDKTLCLAALAAVVAYAGNTLQAFFGNGTLKIVFNSGTNYVSMDSDTVAALELLFDRFGTTRNSLFGFLNHCLTRGGSKQLRSFLLAPPMDKEKIVQRQKAVTELVLKEDVFYQLRDFLKLVQVDVEFIASKIAQVPKLQTNSKIEAEIDLVVYLRHVLSMMESLMAVIDRMDHEAFKIMQEKIDRSGYQEVLEAIQQVISDDCELTKGSVNFKTTKVFAIRKDLSPSLAIEHDVYMEILQDIRATSEEIQQAHDIEENDFKLTYTVARSFHLEVHERGLRNGALPREFIRVEKKGPLYLFTTEKLILLNNRLAFKHDEIIKQARVFVRQLLDHLRDNIGPIYQVAEVIAELDFLCALATTAQKYDLTEPIIDEEETEILDGRNPILVQMLKSPEEQDQIVPNSTNLGPINNFHVITGPNMAGKSVYIRQVALLQILAQIGSHLPAKFAKFRIVDQIFARIGSDDDMETNCSTFMKEITQVKYITERLTQDSLVIIDELGRGTSEEEGVGLCFAVAEFLIRSKAFTLFATHFQDLHELRSLYFNVSSWHLPSIEANDRLGRPFQKYSHVIEERSDSLIVGDYGIKIAEIAGFPSSLISNASRILDKINKDQRPQIHGAENVAKRRHGARLADHLRRVVPRQLNKIKNINDYLEVTRAAYTNDPVMKA